MRRRFTNQRTLGRIERTEKQKNMSEDSLSFLFPFLCIFLFDRPSNQVELGERFSLLSHRQPTSENRHWSQTGDLANCVANHLFIGSDDNGFLASSPQSAMPQPVGDTRCVESPGLGLFFLFFFTHHCHLTCVTLFELHTTRLISLFIRSRKSGL